MSAAPPTAPSERIDALAMRVERLAATPVAEHPAELDRIHQGLVAELDALAEIAGGALRR